ncbi:MAG: hypothetical protein KAS35_06290, partial [Candidatus Marinimicrobia bacterium]|nr:hypothetical protein [Candidatus Neomarinimicrobiota bacterium]
MNLRVRITLGFLIIVVVMVCVSGIIIWQESHMHKAFQHSSQISEIEKYLLECRRQEKNYIIRHDSQSVQLFANNYDSLSILINKMMLSDINEQMELKLIILEKKLMEYQNIFEELIVTKNVKLENNLAIREVGLAREGHKIIGEIKNIASQNFKNAYAITNNVNIFSILIGLFLSVLIAGFISTKIMEIIGRSGE